MGLLGIGFIGGAFFLPRTGLRQLNKVEERIHHSFQQLQEMAKSTRDSFPVLSKPETFATQLQDVVDQVQLRMVHLQEEQEKLSGIVHNLSEGVVAFDSQGRVLFSNPSAGRMLGWKEQNLQGQSVWEVIRNKELAVLVEECRELVSHERKYLEIDIHAPLQMKLEVYGLPFPLTNHKKGSVIVLHDVTTLRRLEQVRSEFIDNVSHEIRTPLSAIIGYLETLIDEPSLETPTNRKFVNVAHQHAERLNRLVDDLRSLSEIEAKQVVLEWEAVSLKDLVDEVVEMFQTSVEKKRLRLNNQINQEDIVWADRDRLLQILLNLVDNAIKYSFEDGKISFLAKRLDDIFVLQVKDTGQGIPSSDLHRITERFYRVDRARSREEGGTGLGLSIVKHLVQLLGGQLRIHSELGKGTNVEIDLPVQSQGNLSSIPNHSSGNDPGL